MDSGQNASGLGCRRPLQKKRTNNIDHIVELGLHLVIRAVAVLIWRQRPVHQDQTASPSCGQ